MGVRRGARTSIRVGMCGPWATAWKPVAVVLMGVGSEPGCASAVVAATSPTRMALWYAVVVAAMARPTIGVVALGMTVVTVQAHTMIMAVATVIAAKFTDGTGVFTHPRVTFIIHQSKPSSAAPY